MAHALGRLDLDLGTAAAGDANIAGQLRQVERRAVADLEGLRDLVELLGALTLLAVAFEPPGARAVFAATMLAQRHRRRRRRRAGEDRERHHHT